MELVDRMLAGDQRALARLMSQVERDDPDVAALMKHILPRLGRAYCVGVTGPPGAGKSTLTDKLTAQARQQGKTVGIVAIDPTSPFSGGAVLGDRIRMQQHYLDAGVFIRSMATRGCHGGLTQATKGVIKLLDAFGKDFIIVETVGVGQTELAVVEAADTTLVVLVPESGDTIQAMKAGLMEIADIYVVNKADREGADRMIAELRLLAHMHPQSEGWEIPIVATQAHHSRGIEELYETILTHRQRLEHTGHLTTRRRKQRRQELLELLQSRLLSTLRAELDKEAGLQELVQQVEVCALDPYTAAHLILQERHP